MSQNKLAFSTLGCPDWTWEQVLKNAARFGYAALELRGLHIHRELSDAPEFLPQNRAESLRQAGDAGLTICVIGSSAVVAKAADEATTATMAEHLRFYCDLARDLRAPYVRIFGGKLPEDQPRTEGLRRFAEALRSMGDIAKESGSALVLETHDSFSTGASVAELLALADHDAVFSLWDFHHPYREGEPIAETFQYLAPTMRHIHIKNSVLRDGKASYSLPNEGDVPMAEMLTLALQNGYDGAISVEWEKRWQPDIADPEIALPAYADFLRRNIALQ